MSHHVYTTDAYIIDSNPSGEANKMFTLFTRDLGMIRASAQGVRLLKSKLRFSLQDFSFATVSIVRGKEVWRITNARALSNIYEMHHGKPEIIKITAQIFALLKRLMPGEDTHEKLFGYIHNALIYLERGELTQQEYPTIEALIVLNILHELGYLGNIPELDMYIGVPLTPELLQSFEPKRKLAYKEINRSLKETQL